MDKAASIQQQAALDLGKRLAGRFEEASNAQKLKRYRGLNLYAHWRFWREVAYNPDFQQYNQQKLRNEGVLEVATEDRRLRVNVNLVNEQLLDMVAKETAEPLAPEIVIDTKDGVIQLPDAEPVATDGVTAPIYPSMTADEFADKSKRYITAETDAMFLESYRERIAYCRRSFGTHYIGLEWDPGRGQRRKYVEAKNGEKWDVVSGTFTRDGDAITVNVPGTQRTARYEKDQWREEYRAEGGPRLVEYFVWQVKWEGKQNDRRESRGVFLEDYITEQEAKDFYRQSDIYGTKVDVDWTKQQPETVPADDAMAVPDLRFVNFQAGTKVYRRVRYRRRPAGNEQRSQWFTIIGTTTPVCVRAQACPLAERFDQSLAVYGFIDRLIPGQIEGLPSIAYMITDAIMYNLFRGMEHAILEKMIIGKLLAKGDPKNPPEIGMADSEDVDVIVSPVDLTPLETSHPPAELQGLKMESKQNIQTYSADQALLLGSRTQDMKTATQSVMQQRANQGKVGVNLKRDALEWEIFYNDLVALLSDERYVTQPRSVSIYGKTGTGLQYQENFVPTMTFLQHIGAIKIGPQSLLARGQQELENIFTLQRMLPMAAPGMPDPYMQTRNDLVRRTFEIMDITGVRTPPPQVLDEAAAAGALGPAPPGAGAPAGGGTALERQVNRALEQ